MYGIALNHCAPGATSLPITVCSALVHFVHRLAKGHGCFNFGQNAGSDGPVVLDHMGARRLCVFGGLCVDI